jgi:hypothetical protein
MNYDVRCPYCGAVLDLGLCVIVATNFHSRQQTIGIFNSSVDAVADVNGTDDFELPSGRQVIGVANGWPVVARPVAPAEPRRGFGRLLTGRPLTPVEEVAAPEDMPARLCPNCEYPLPADMDDRELLTIAVVGINGASKTHFLASSLTTAYHDQGLRDLLRCTEFSPDEDTGVRFHEDYYQRIAHGRLFEATQEAGVDDGRVHPMIFRARFADGEPLSILLHDVSGEVFRDSRKRNNAARFLRWADGVIFVIDPTWFSSIQAYLQTLTGHEPSPPPYNQAVLINAVADALGQRDLNSVPVAAVVSKCDLIGPALQRTNRFDEAPPGERSMWMTDMNEVSDEVEKLLETDFKALDLLAAVERFPNRMYHAVSPLGQQPLPGQQLSEIRPHRVLDPLASILVRLPGRQI